MEDSMKLKAALTLSVLSIVSIAAIARASTQAWDFYAPSVSSSSAIPTPKEGDIIYSSVAGGFFGYTITGWQSMDGGTIPSLNVIKVTADLTLDPTAHDVVLADATAGTPFNLTLPTAGAGNVGKVFHLKKVDSTYTVVTVVGTIDGETANSFKLYTPGESYTIVSADNSWKLLKHESRTLETTVVATTLVSTGGAKGNSGTPVVDKVSWHREGKYAVVRMDYQQTTAGSTATDFIRLTLPNSLSIDTTATGTNSSANSTGCMAPAGLQSTVYGNLGTSSSFFGHVTVYDANNVRFGGVIGSGVVGCWGNGILNLGNPIVTMGADFKVPISGWKD
jgi:hypothetical protein